MTLMEPHPICFIHFWALHQQKDNNALDCRSPVSSKHLKKILHTFTKPQKNTVEISKASAGITLLTTRLAAPFNTLQHSTGHKECRFHLKMLGSLGKIHIIILCIIILFIWCKKQCCCSVDNTTGLSSQIKIENNILYCSCLEYVALLNIEGRIVASRPLGRGCLQKGSEHNMLVYLEGSQFSQCCGRYPW